MVGAALLDSRVLGVVDLGRFLGLARVQQGPWLIPSSAVSRDWALQVHGAEPIECAVPIAHDDDDDGADGGPVASAPLGQMAESTTSPVALSQRRPPAFWAGRVQWDGVEGHRLTADVLSLAGILCHPRIRDLQS